MLAGMGVLLITNRTNYSIEERKIIRDVITGRSKFLFVLVLRLLMVAGRHFTLLWRIHAHGSANYFLAKKVLFVWSTFCYSSFSLFAFSYPV